MLAGKKGLGYDTVLSATTLNEVEYFIRQNLGQIRLILSSDAEVDALDIPLTRAVIRQPELHLVPFVLMLNGGRSSSINGIQGDDQRSRVDGVIKKPFGTLQLKESIELAHRRRNSLRSSLLVLGPESATLFSEAFYACRNLVHWQEVVPVSSTEALGRKIKELGFRVGGILIDPAHCDASVIARIMRFKKSFEGSMAQVAVLSRDPVQVADIRLYCDHFFDSPHESEPVEREEILLRMSRRLILGWESRHLAGQGRQALGNGDIKIAEKLAKKGLSLDPERGEFLELAGAVARRRGKKQEAIAQFVDAQRANPCSPFSYLNLIQLLEGPELERMLNLARAFCPRHPQVLAAIERAQNPNLSPNLSRDSRV